MKRISVAAILITVIWLSFALNGHGLTQGVVAQHVIGYPNVGQGRYYVIVPSVIAFIAASSGVCFWFGRFKVAGRIVQITTFFLLFPYLFFYFGGI